MWKYRKSIYSGVFAGVIYTLYIILLQSGSAATVYNVCDVIFKDYTYQFMFSFLIFNLLYKSNDIYLSLSRFKSLVKYQRLQLISDVIDIVIFFSVSVIMQIMANTFVVSFSNIGVLVIRNMVLLCVACVVSYLHHYVFVKNRLSFLILLFLFWNFEMIALLHFPRSVFGMWNIFVMAQDLDMVVMLRWIGVMLGVLCLTHYVNRDQEKGVRKWLD